MREAPRPRALAAMTELTKDWLKKVRSRVELGGLREVLAATRMASARALTRADLHPAPTHSPRDLPPAVPAALQG